VAKPTGFLDYVRREVAHRAIDQRICDHFEVEIPHEQSVLVQQAARCMDCGIPFCHAVGCPLANRIPDFNDLVYKGRWRDACEVLHDTNNFPEITGRICPALCEASCTLNINDDPVLIRHIELQIAEKGFEEGWIVPQPAQARTGRKVAIIGSGPAGLTVAQQLARAGHDVVVFEKDAKVGGLLRYGIPDFKLAKSVLDRRLEQMAQEGVEFQTDVHIGDDISAKYLTSRFDAICLAIGAGQPRDLMVPGRELENVHFAMDFLRQQNRLNARQPLADGQKRISAKDKVVVVIGGGDTGSDCVGTAARHGAAKIHQFEILPKPPEGINPETPWPQWPTILRTSSSHEEGCQRRWSVKTTKLTGTGSQVNELHGVQVQWQRGANGWEMRELPGTEFSMKVDMVILAMGFEHAVHSGIVEQFGLAFDARGNIAIDEGNQTSCEGVFATGDSVSGASLVVRAIASGRSAAGSVDRWLAR